MWEGESAVDFYVLRFTGEEIHYQHISAGHRMDLHYSGRQCNTMPPSRSCSFHPSFSFSHIAPAHCEAFFSSPKNLLKKHLPFVSLCLCIFFNLQSTSGFAVGIKGAGEEVFRGISSSKTAVKKNKIIRTCQNKCICIYIYPLLCCTENTDQTYFFGWTIPPKQYVNQVMIQLKHIFIIIFY